MLLSYLGILCGVIIFLYYTKLFLNLKNHYDDELTEEGKLHIKNFNLDRNDIETFIKRKKIKIDKDFFKKIPKVKWFYLSIIIIGSIVNPIMLPFLVIAGIIAYYDQYYMTSPFVFSLTGALIGISMAYLSGGFNYNYFLMILFPFILYLLAVIITLIFGGSFGLVDLEYYLLIAIFLKIPLLGIIFSTFVIIIYKTLFNKYESIRKFHNKISISIKAEKLSFDVNKKYIIPATPLIYISIFFLMTFLGYENCLRIENFLGGAFHIF